MSGWESLAAKAAYDLAKQSGFWNSWKTWLKRRRKILVLGGSGTGKTQLINSIMNPMSEKLTTLQRTVAVEKRNITIGEYPFIFSDTPGQLLDEAKRKIAITDAIRSQIEGVLNVVSFGYHEAAEARKERAIPESGGHIARSDYLQDRRAIEERLLSEWVPMFDPATAKWVLTVATKADLWWPDRDRVEKHYSEGSYAEGLGSFRTSHTLVPYCSIIEPFYGTKTSGRFGEHQKYALQSNLLDCLLRLSGVCR